MLFPGPSSALAGRFCRIKMLFNSFLGDGLNHFFFLQLNTHEAPMLTKDTSARKALPVPRFLSVSPFTVLCLLFSLISIIRLHAKGNMTIKFVLFHLLRCLPTTSAADPDFELRRGAGSILLTQPAFLPSVVSYFFFTQNKGARGPRPPPLDPPLNLL